MINDPVIILVDENDAIIGAKKRSLVSMAIGDIYRITALWVTNSEGAILLAQRSFSKRNHPGRWAPPVSGTVEEGESYDENIIKEAQEEIGLSDIPFAKLQKLRRSIDQDFFVQWYWVVIDRPAEEFAVQKDEIEDIRWFTKEALLDAIKNEPSKFVPNLVGYIELFTEKSEVRQFDWIR